MSKVNGRRVLRAALPEALFVPGLGQIQKDLNAVATAEHSAVDMVVDEPFLVCNFTSRQTKQLVEIAIPLAQVKNLVLVSEPKPLPKPLKE